MSEKGLTIWNPTNDCLNNYGSCLLEYDEIENTITVALNKYHQFLFHAGIFHEENWFDLYENDIFIGSFCKKESLDNIYKYLNKIKYNLRNRFRKKK